MAEEKRPGNQPAGEGSPPPAAGAPPRRPTTRGQQRRHQRSVFQYITILFAAAFILLLFTYLMERRQYELVQEHNQEQIDDLQQSASAVQRLDALYEENAALKEELDGLTAENRDLEARLDESTAALDQASQAAQGTGQAMDWFWQIDEAYVRGRYSLCRDLIQSLEEAELVQWLPRESVTDNGRFSPYDRYREIYDALY